MTSTPEVSRIYKLEHGAIISIYGYSYKKANSKQLYFSPSRVMAERRAYGKGLLLIPNL